MANGTTDAALQLVIAMLRVVMARVDLLDLKLDMKGDETMVALADIQAKAANLLSSLQAETNIVNAVKMVVNHQNDTISGLKQQIADLIAAGGADTAALQTLSDTLDQIQAQDVANATVVANAIAAGTPAEEPPPAPPAG